MIEKNKPRKLNDHAINMFNNFVVIGVGIIFTKCVSFVLIPFYTSWLTTADYGTFDLIVTYISLLVPITSLQLDQAIYRFCMDKKRSPKIVFSKALLCVFPMIIITGLICAFILTFVLNQIYTKEFILYYVSFALYSCCSEYLRGNSRLKLYASINILIGILIVVLSVIYVYIFNMGINGMLLVYASAYASGSFFILVMCRPFSVNKCDSTLTSEMLQYSIPLIPNSVSWWAMNVSDRTIISLLLGTAANAVYAVSCKIPTILSILFSIFNLTFQHTAIQSIDEKDSGEFFCTLYKKLIIFIFTGSIVIISFVPFIFHSFLKQDYWGGIIIVPLLLGGSIFLSLAQFLGNILLAKKNTRIIGSSTIIGAILNLAFNIIFIKKYGIFAAAVSTLFSYIVMFVIRYRKMRNLFQNGSIINLVTKYVIVYTLFSIVCILYVENNRILYITIFCSIILFANSNKNLFIKILYLVKGKLK